MTTWLPTEEQFEAAKRAWETGLWYWGDVSYENAILWKQIWAEAREEFMKKNHWARQWLDTIS